MKLGNSILAIGLFGFLLGCGRSEPPETPVARVDEEILTLENIMARFDTSQTISEAQVHEFIERWLLDELLYREAVRRGLDRREDVEMRIQDARRRFVINALLEEEIYAKARVTIKPEEIRSYYEVNRSLFVLNEDVALISMMVFATRDAANAFRTVVLRGKQWTEAKRGLFEDPAQQSVVGGSIDSAYYTSRTLLPPELWRVASGIARREPSFPVRTDDGFFVLIVWRLDRTGEPADVAYVADEIRDRLTIRERQRLYDEFVAGLRGRHNIQVLLSAPGSPGDSAGTRMNKGKEIP